MDKIIALVSGLDSFCYLGQYIDRYKIEVLLFNYGQRAQTGVEQMTYLIDSLKGKHPLLIRRTLNMQFLKVFYPNFQQTEDNLYPQPNYNPSVVLPLRNTIFLTVAMAQAQQIRASKIIIGSTIDDTGLLGIDKFPDLNPSYLLNLEKLLERGCLPWAQSLIEIWSPARSGMTKTKNLKNGFEVFGERVFETWSCYMDDDLDKVHCGRCYGCSERQRVFKQAGIEDKTEYKEKM